MEQLLLNLLLALVTNAVLHTMREIATVHIKIRRLAAYIDKQPWQEMKIKIDKRWKEYTISFIAFFLIVVPLWIFYAWLNLSFTAAAYLMIGQLIFMYAFTIVALDQYHVAIERITRPFMKK